MAACTYTLLRTWVAHTTHIALPSDLLYWMGWVIHWPHRGSGWKALEVHNEEEKKRITCIYIYISLGRNENNFYTVMRIITLNLTQPSSHVMLTSIEFPSIQRLQIRFVPECSTKIVVSDVSQFTSTRSSLSVWKERLKFSVSQNFLCGYSMYSACKSIHHRDSAWSETRPSRYCVNIVN